ncbi:hypothetical protein K2P47_00275 [Patescibacteria group bacterium]|nr:hypothetical protein [Patescibacteria group bacterium]
MKYLEIKNSKGLFNRDGVMIEIDQITAEDLLTIINHAHEEDFEIDEYTEAALPNKAHQLIYQNIYIKLTDFLSDKNQFNQQVDKLYEDAIGKYNADIPAEAEPEVDNINDFKEADAEEINPEDIPF